MPTNQLELPNLRNFLVKVLLIAFVLCLTLSNVMLLNGVVQAETRGSSESSNFIGSKPLQNYGNSPTLRNNALSNPPYAIVEPQTIVFPEPSVRKDSPGYGYDRFTLEGCDYITKPGYPMLPVRTIAFKVNLGYEVSGVKVEVSTKALDGIYTVMLAPLPSPLGIKENPFPVSGDPAVYSGVKPYPEEWYSWRVAVGLDPDTMVRVKYVIVHLYPLQYTLSTGKITRIETATASVEYSGLPVDPIASINLLVITSSTLQTQALSYATYRNSTGVSTIVRTTDWIYARYSGTDNQEKIRNCIKDFVITLGIQYVLIFGNNAQVPVRLAYIPDGYDDAGTTDGSVVETDLYYADLQYTWDTNGDGKWGDPQYDQIDGIPDLYVGRLPVATTTEASTVVSNIQNYEQNTKPSDSWFKKMLLLGTDTFDDAGAVAEGEFLKNYFQSNFIWSNFTVTKLYETAGNLTVSATKTQINNGYGFVNYAGHGDYNCWAGGYSNWPWPFGYWYYDSDASGQTNGPKLPVIFVDACLTSRFSDRESLGEAFILNPNGGAIAYFGATRVSWGYQGTWVTTGLGGEIDWRLSKAFFDGNKKAGKVWGAAVTAYVQAHAPNTYYSGNGYLDWKTAAEYGSPFTDPTLMIGGGVLQLNIRTKDWAGNILPSCYVNVSGVGSKVSDSNGWANFTIVASSTYTTTVRWQGTKVNQTSVSITTSDVTMDVKCHVWSLTINAKDNAGNFLQPNNMRIYATFPNGTHVNPANVSSKSWKVQNGTYYFTVKWQGSWVYGNASVALDTTTATQDLTCKVFSLSFSFKNSDGTVSLYIKPSRINVSCPNGTSLTVMSNYTLKLQNGTYAVTSIKWNGVDVVPSTNPTIFLMGSSILEIKCLVYDLKIKVIGSFGLPVSGATVSITLPNGTIATVQTDNNGLAVFSQIPQGAFSGSVSYFGQTVSISGDVAQASVTQVSAKVTFSIPEILSITLLIVGVCVAVFVWRRRRKAPITPTGLPPPPTIQPQKEEAPPLAPVTLTPAPPIALPPELEKAPKKTCLNCGAENPANAVYCRKCGHSI